MITPAVLLQSDLPAYQSWIVDHFAKQRIEYQRYWSKFHVDNEGNYNIPQLSISSKGKTTEIGGFLNYKDKLTLINLIKDVTDRFQTQAQ